MSNSPQIFNVAIVEDHDLVREALASAIKRDDRFSLAGQAGDGTSALSLIEEVQPDIAVVDFALPDMTGLEVITEARERSPKTRFLILTGSLMDQGERASLADLAEGFMHKETGRDALMDAILRAGNAVPLRSGKDYQTDDTAGVVNAGSLTNRERAVLREIARGHPIDQIANGLGISVATVRKHRENIMSKLRLNSTAQLVRAAMQIGQY